MKKSLLDGQSISRAIRISFWVFGISLGIAETIASRFSMIVDGISYLDLGHAIWTGDWNAAINGYWSPLYAWIIGGVLRIGGVSGYWESTVVHVANFFIFLASMVAFEFFLHELCKTSPDPANETDVVRPLPLWAVQGIGYSFCLYAGLVWISIGNVTPDQCVAIVMYLAAALLLRIKRNPSGWGMYAALGALLGLGYLTKAALLPLGLVSLVATVFLGPREKFGTQFARSLVAALLFAMVAAPLVIALSQSKGRLTAGDTGKIAYAEIVDGVSRYGFWLGEGNVGTPKHPVRKLSGNPDVFEFATPVGGTYPPWYDASYWLDGLVTHVDIGKQSAAIVDGSRAYAAMALQQLALIGAIVILCLLGWRIYSYWRELWSICPVWIAPLAGLGMFSLVLVETRYVASFLVIIAMCLLAGIRVRPSETSRRAILLWMIAVAGLNLLGAARFAPRNAYSALFRPRHVEWEVAQALAAQGVRPSDTVATMIDHRSGDYWAHLAQVKIIEDIPYQEEAQVALLDGASSAHLIEALRGPGAKVIVTTPAPPPGGGFQWRRLGNTEYFDASLTNDQKR
jgi:hypothetical protein